MQVTRPLPPKLREIIDFNYQFPVDWPVVDNTISPDATRTLKQVIINSLQNYYYDHRIFTHVVPDFNRHFQNRLFNKMVQHQYWIDQFLHLIEDNQFFYNDEEQNLSRNAASNSVVNGLSKESDTPQNMVGDINTYLTAATKTDDLNSVDGTETELNTIHKSTLGDITVQFKNFAGFSNFIDQLVTAVSPCFIGAYSDDYDDDYSYFGFRFERATDPDRTLVYDPLDQLVATLTDGCKTVALKGATRTFIESSPGINDNFTRTNVDSFGRAETGGRYFITESVAGDFDVADGVGTMNVTTVNASRRATLSQTNILKSFSGQVKIKTDKVAAGASQEAGITFGYVDLLNHYEAVLRFTSTGTVQVGIIKKIDGDTNLIGAYVQVAATRNIADWWRLKMFWDSATGQIKAKAWIVGDAEPTTWAKEEVDTTYTKGRIGLRSILNTSTSNAPVLFSYDDLVGTGDWPTNPIITHDTWVRFLSYNYNNVNDDSLVAWLKIALKDTSNDLFAESIRYLPTGDLNAGYGPLESDGTRHDGSDWNDYLGQTADYSETSEGTVAPDDTQLGFTDCSGWERLLLKTFGIHLSLYVFDGIHVPRESTDIMDNSDVGVAIIPRSGTTQITDFTKVQIGDLVGFDADLTDPEEGQVDHLGWFMGYDKFKKARFFSSRATPNGPTFADVGGQSVLNGTTNLYTKRFVCTRRI